MLRSFGYKSRTGTPPRDPLRKKKIRRSKKHNEAGFLEIIEILQMSVIMFLLSLGAAFVISNIFTPLDREVEKLSGNKSLYDFVKILVVFIQLVVTALAYYFIDIILHWFPSISAVISSRYETHKVMEYGIHVILIIILVETNSSLYNGLHDLGKIMKVS